MKASDLPFTTNLKDKVAVITGAGGVLCSLMGKALAACGAKVAIMDLHLTSAQKVVDEIIAEGYIAKAYEANCLDKNSLLAAHAAIFKDFGKCDILINGAGGNSPKASTTQEFYAPKVDEDTITFFDLKEEGFNFVFNLNILATLVTTQIFAEDMIGREGCSILNISSMNAFTPLTKIPAYSSAKAGVSNFTKWLATYFAKEGIRVNAIAPGFFATAQNRALLFNPDGTPTARTGKILNNTPMGRFGEPKELLGSVLFLTDSAAASFVTGVVLPIDGGFSAYSGV
jgi:NAD(P)-dependent dehydrogenase (short-subunit alcohol dehydrogenase family)